MRALLLVLALAGCAAIEPAATFTNPVLDRDFPDPAVLRAPDGWFYAYATQSEHGGKAFNLQVARSRDLVRWEHLGDALPVKPAWAASKQKFWAPHVIYDAQASKYFLYYSAEPDDASGKCLAVATSPRPEGPFADRGSPLLCGEGIEHIDPMAFDDPRSGKRLLYWGSGGKPILAQELAPSRLAFARDSSPREVLRPGEGKYRSLIEAAWVVYRAGSYYLFYSGDRCCVRDPRYAVMVARSGDPLGPFEERSEPVVEASARWSAPGHNSIVTDDEDTDWIVYHAVAAGDFQDGRPLKRLMLLDRLHYALGWPRVAQGRPADDPQMTPLFRHTAPR